MCMVKPDEYLHFDQTIFILLFLTVEAAGGKALPCIVDVRDENQINEAVEKAVQKFGGQLSYISSHDVMSCLFRGF